MIRKLARPMVASVYIADGADTIMNTQAHVEGTKAVLDRTRTILPRKYARQLPKDAETVTRALGATKVGAGSLLALGKAPRISAATLALASVPTILARHAFWETQDKEEKVARRQGFLTSVALLGGLFITSADTAGKPGLKWRTEKAAQRANKKIQKALPTKSETEKFTEAAGENAAVLATATKGWLGEAADKVSEYAEKATDYVNDNKDDWKATAADAAATAKKSVSEASGQAQGFLKDNSGDWLATAQKNAKVAKKKAVKAASAAQERATEAYAKAEKSAGRSAKKASKRADKLQKKADKTLSKAQKKIKNI